MIVKYEQKITGFNAVTCAVLEFLKEKSKNKVFDLRRLESKGSGSNDVKEEIEHIYKIVIACLNELDNIKRIYCSSSANIGKEIDKLEQFIKDYENCIKAINEAKSIPQEYINDLIRILKKIRDVVESELNKLSSTLIRPFEVIPDAIDVSGMFNEHGLTARERDILCAMKSMKREGVSLSDLSERLNITKPNLYRYLKILLFAGYVTKIRHGNKIIYKLTNKAKKIKCEGVGS